MSETLTIKKKRKKTPKPHVAPYNPWAHRGRKIIPSTSGKDCPICFEELSSYNLKVCNWCRACMHHTCWRKWIKNDARCIMCRASRDFMNSGDFRLKS